ncbi:enoyl-CoA hydratase [Bacillaceae bacterium S4-13-58]
MEFIHLESRQGVSILTLNRPKKLNAINSQMLLELDEALEMVDQNDHKLLIVRGAGQGFCSGGDISMMKEISDQQTFNDIMELIEKIITKIYLMDKIVIAMIQGPAVGLGLSLALACDYVIAHKRHKLSMNFIGIGLVPDGGGHFWLKERLGVTQASKFIWSGQEFEGEESLTHGLVDLIVEKDLESLIDEVVAYWHSRPLQSVVATKLIYHRSLYKELQKYLEQEKEMQWKMRQTADHQEGVQAFLEKRRPKFEGK